MNLPLNIDLQQILLHLLNFVILATGLYLLLYKPVKGFMDKRTAEYEKMDNSAKEKMTKAQELEENYQLRLSEIDAETKKRREEAEKEIREEIALKLQDAEKTAEQIIAHSKEIAEGEREKMLAEAKKNIAVLAIDTTQRLLVQSSGGVYDQFIDALERSETHE